MERVVPLRELAPLRGIGMVSRIRVEVRGTSMEAAEDVANLFLQHAQMAGYLEGIVPQSGSFTDHFFNYPQMTKAGLDQWSELGLRYAGRIAFTFEPMSNVAHGEPVGGLRQYGHEVLAVPIAERPDDGRHGYVEYDPSDPASLAGFPVVTDTVMVLERQRLATREHSWETGDVLVDSGMAEASAEEILDNIRRLTNVVEVTMSVGDDPELAWRVFARVHTERTGETKVGVGATLREAALDCYGRCGVEVTHYDTEVSR